MSFHTLFTGTQALSFYGFLLPWLFTFAIVYGLLDKANLFGTGTKRQVNIALAFVVAFFVTGVGGPQLAFFFTQLFSGASVFLAGILVFILFVTLIGGERPKGYHTGVIGFLVVLVIAIILFVTSSGTFAGFVFLDAATASLIFWFVIIIIAAFLITRVGGPAKEEEKKT